MEGKNDLLLILSGTVCPVCQKTKDQFRWTCAPCYRPYEHTPEQDRLSKTCDAHMAAAAAFLDRLRPRRPKTERD